MRYFSGLFAGLFVAAVGLAFLAVPPANASTEILIDLSGVSNFAPATAPSSDLTAPPYSYPTTNATTPTSGTGAWNNLDANDAFFASSVTPKISNLVSTAGASTGVSVYVTDNFNPYVSDYNGGETTTTTGYPSNATYDGWYVYSANPLDTSYNVQGTIELSGLSPLLPVDIRFYAGAVRTDGFARPGNYVAVGLNTVPNTTYDAYNNTTNVGLLAEVIPDASGHIFLTVTPGGDASQSAFLDLLDITITPEPASCSLLVIGMAGMMMRRRRA